MSWMPRSDDPTEYALAISNGTGSYLETDRMLTNGTRVPVVAYCGECGREISAEGAAENGGNCVRHASGDRWRAGDDYY